MRFESEIESEETETSPVEVGRCNYMLRNFIQNNF